MAVQIVDRVWKSGRHDGAALIVLLAMADYASKETGEFFPSQETLAKKCRMNRRSVQRAIKELVAGGDIVILHHGGAKKGDRYEHSVYRMGKMYSRDGNTPPLNPPRGDKYDNQGAAECRTNRQENRTEEGKENLYQDFAIE